MTYDLVIIGGGAGGLTCALYSTRYGLKTLVVSKEFGGLTATADEIMNWPGTYSISGFQLMQDMQEQVKKNGAEFKFGNVTKVVKEDNKFIVETDSEKFEGKKVVYATGTEHRHLGIPGEKEFRGKGISYCATCDGPFFKDKVIAVVGGGNSALTAALLLARHGKKVYIIYRQSEFFRAEKHWVEEVEKAENIECLHDEEVLEVKGDKFMNQLVLKSGKEVDADGLFIEIGLNPIIDVVKDIAELENGYIKVDKRQETSLKGLYAVGDVTTNSNEFKQIVTACGEGAVASNSIYEDLSRSS
ncbi:FAD-dependent oxidoreductase [Candidatus Woesearchaeota archaeon]|nr:FAD-dependent oxidoreductase [Candidatus Woesearchaeota archaeon]